MTLWRRTRDGVALCAIALSALLIAEALLRSGVLILESLGGAVGVLAYVFSFPLLVAGLILIIGGILGHLQTKWKRSKTDD